MKQRITVTRKGQELQDQLKDMMKKQPQQMSVKSYQEYAQVDFNDGKQNASDQFNGYIDVVENRLKSPKQIKDFLSSKFATQPLFVQRELDRVSKRIYHYGNQLPLVSTPLPALDFRQTQHLKSKYNSLSTSELKSETFTSSQFFNSAKTLEENKAKKVNYVLFQEAKIERMINKYEKFNEKAKNIPSYEKNQKKGDNFTDVLLRKLEGQGQETRVETIKEINSRMGDQLQLMEYNSQMKERLRQTMNELHDRKYRRQWKELHLPGERKIQKKSVE